MGKTTCARILAKTINCENLQPDGEACNTCGSCVSFHNGGSFNIHELDAASNNSVEDIRELIDQVRFVPQAGKYKVYIIDEVHMLSQFAFNAFLKTLEEPPHYAIFILATTEKHKILPTILSRCQIFDFKRITDKDTVEHLEEIVEKEHIKAEKTALQVIAQKSEGCMRDALSTLDKIVSFTGGDLTYANTLEHLNILDEDYFFRFLEHMQQQDLAGSMLLYDEINRKGFDGEILLNELAGFFRNLMVCQDARTLSLLEVVEGFRDRYAQSAKKTSLPWLIGGLNILNDAVQGYKQARNKKLHVELALVRLSYLQQAVEWTDNDGDAVKKKGVEDMKPVRFRKIPLMEVKQHKRQDTPEKKSLASMSAPSSARLIIETPANGTGPEEKQKLGVEEPLRRKETPEAKKEEAKPRSSMGALHKIRQEMQQRSQGDRVSGTALTEALLKEAWEQYINHLTEQKNHTTATNLKHARISITGEKTFDIHTDTNLQQRFIEQERGGLIEHLHKFFNNRLITYQLVLDMSADDNEPTERPLSKREQFLLMSGEYPLVSALKERLKLDLD